MSRTLPVQCLVLLPVREAIDRLTTESTEIAGLPPPLPSKTGQQMPLVHKTNMNINNQPSCILYHLFAFSIHYLKLRAMFAYLGWLRINILRRSFFLMSFIVWSSHVCRLSTMFTKQNPAAKSERMMVCTAVPGSFGATVPPTRPVEVAWLFPDFHLFLSNVWNREIWCWKSILEWPHHWPLQWEVPFGMGLSFYDIVIAATARADAKFGFLEAGTQSTIIVYSFVKIWDTCPKCWRLEMFENIFKTFPYFKNGIWSASRLLTLYWNVLTAIDCQ